MLRRTLLALPATLFAQDGLNIEWVRGPVPASIADECVIFPRAYTGCPDGELGWRTLEMSRYPHAQREDGELVRRYRGSQTVTVYTIESADGGEGPEDRTTRVPLAIRWPQRLVPHVANELLISHMDVLPTILGLAGLAIPAQVQGRDLSSRLSTGRGELPDAIFAEGRIGRVDEWRMLVRGFDKLVWNLRGETTGLYNLVADPQEEQNLHGTRDHELMRDSMWALAQDWMRRLEDRMDRSGLRRRG